MPPASNWIRDEHLDILPQSTFLRFCAFDISLRYAQGKEGRKKVEAVRCTPFFNAYTAPVIESGRIS